MHSDAHRLTLVAFNALVRAAQYEYTVRIDADDEVALDFLERAAAELTQEPADILEFPVTYVTLKDGASKIVPSYQHIRLTGKSIFDWYFNKSGCPTTLWARTYRTSLLQKYIPPDVDGVIQEDIIYTTIINYLAESYRFVPGPPVYTYYYQFRPHAIDILSKSRKVVADILIEFYNKEKFDIKYLKRILDINAIPILGRLRGFAKGKRRAFVIKQCREYFGYDGFLISPDNYLRTDFYDRLDALERENQEAIAKLPEG